MATMSGRDIMQGLIERGYSPVQAAALAGHMMKESSGNSAEVNPTEDAHGLLQWRLDRWGNLQKFAKERGVDPTDPNLQLDFVRREMEGPEQKAGSGFLAAKDVPSASAALKPYIRFGDKSDDARLANAQSLYEGGTGSPGAGSKPAGVAAAPLANVPPVAPTVPQEAQAQTPQMPKMAAPQTMQLAPFSVAPVDLSRARQLALAMLSKPIGG